MNFEAFLWSLTQQESGGDYHVVNQSSGAIGRYQVMPYNVGPWTAKYYGKRLTPEQFRYNRAAQDAVVRGVLGSYVKQYGYRGAASAWYSGNPNLHMSTRAQPGGPSIKGYVDSVMNRAATYRGGSTTGSGTSYTGGAPVTPELDMGELAVKFGLSANLINSSGELKSLFQRAVREGWGNSQQGVLRFQAHLKNTKWWKSQSSTLRKYVTLRYTDPATWAQQRTAAIVKMNTLAVQVGLGDQINRRTGKASKLLTTAAYYSQALGWSDARIKDWLGARATVNGGVMWGEAGDAFDKLHEVAYLNGMRYSQDWYKNRAVAVVAGRATVSTYEDQIRAAAAARYSAFAEQIRAGQNVMDLAAPYLKATAQILELAESDVDLFNKHVAKAMTTKGADGAAMPLWQFETAVRSDPLWKKTNNARESLMSVARQVAKDFGLAY